MTSDLQKTKRKTHHENRFKKISILEPPGAKNELNFGKNVGPLIAPSGFFRNLQKSASKHSRGNENEARKD